MRTYQINAISRKGQEIHEMVSADDVAALQQIIKKRELYLIDYREIKSAAVFGKKLKTKDRTYSLKTDTINKRPK